MEKLIKLINEHQKEKHPDGIYLPVVAYRDWIFWSDSDCLSSVMDEIHLVSKNYWFIKWLIDNDKIETKRLDTIEIIPKFWWTIWKKAIWEKRILMLLSIQDDQTKFLVSILK